MLFRLSDHNISETPKNNDETLNAPGSNQAIPYSSNQNQGLTQSVDPQNQASSSEVPSQQTAPYNQQKPNQVSTNSPTNSQIHSPSESRQIAESPSSKNRSQLASSKHQLRPGNSSTRADHTTEDTFSSEDNSGWSSSSSGQRQRVRKSVVARNSIRQSLGNFRQLINLQGRPGVPGQSSPSSYTPTPLSLHLCMFHLYL